MPLIFKVRCDGGFESPPLSSAHAVADLDAGHEAICGHPGERRAAKDLTGQDWPELVKAGRIGYRYPLTCKVCGATDYYRTRRAFRGGPYSGLIGGITHIPSSKEASTPSCSACGAKSQLVPSSRLGNRWWNSKVDCPKCKNLLTIDVTGRS